MKRKGRFLTKPRKRIRRRERKVRCVCRLCSGRMVHPSTRSRHQLKHSKELMNSNDLSRGSSEEIQNGQSHVDVGDNIDAVQMDALEGVAPSPILQAPNPASSESACYDSLDLENLPVSFADTRVSVSEFSRQFFSIQAKFHISQNAARQVWNLDFCARFASL